MFLWKWFRRAGTLLHNLLRVLSRTMRCRTACIIRILTRTRRKIWNLWTTHHMVGVVYLFSGIRSYRNIDLTGQLKLKCEMTLLRFISNLVLSLKVKENYLGCPWISWRDKWCGSKTWKSWFPPSEGSITERVNSWRTSAVFWTKILTSKK